MSAPTISEPQEPQPQSPPSAPTPLVPEDRDTLAVALRAMHPEAVPELITGDTVAALLASVAPAKEAYTRVRRTVAAHAPVGAGGGGRDAATVLAFDRLSPFEKILHGLKEQ